MIRTASPRGAVSSQFRAASRFLNELAWFYQLPVRMLFCVHGNGTPSCEAPSTLIRDEVVMLHDFKQRVYHENAHIGLGFYREGLAAESPYYRFLSYYKILEIPFKNGKARGDWIDSVIPGLRTCTLSLERLRHAGVTDVGSWLREEGRLALSHAGLASDKPIIDVTDHDHWQNIVWSSEIILELAEQVVVEHLGVEAHSQR